jgi:dCMP deaminase
MINYNAFYKFYAGGMTLLEKKFLLKAMELAKHSNCIRDDRCIGAVAVRDNEIILSAVNGTSERVEGCVGRCVRHMMGIKSGTNAGLSQCLCAEQHLIAIAARDGIALKGCELYCTHSPCFVCIKLLVECGFAAVYYSEDYPDAHAKSYAQEAGIKIERISI